MSSLKILEMSRQYRECLDTILEMSRHLEMSIHKILDMSRQYKKCLDTILEMLRQNIGHV